MTDDKFVPIDVFLTTPKALLSQNYELTVGVQVLRSALMNAKSEDFPLDIAYLTDVDARIRQTPQLIAAKKAIETIESASTVDKIIDILGKPGGPIQ